MEKIFKCLIVSLSIFLASCFENRKNESVILDKNITPQLNKIVFASERGGKKKIYSMNKDGSDVKQLTSGNEFSDTEPSWSPDGRYITFSRSWIVNGDELSEIFVMNADGSGQQRFTHHFLTSLGPVWSPDGKNIAYYIWDLNNWEIFIAPLTGEAPRNLTQNPETQTYPSWSPDGKTIAFHQQEEDGDWNIYRINENGTDKRRLTSNKNEDWLPAWSPDGKTLSFWSTRTGRWEVFFMDENGNNQRQITHSINSNRDSLCKSVWSPDGGELAIMMDIENESADIVRFEVSSGKFNRLTNSSTKDYCLDWSLGAEK